MTNIFLFARFRLPINSQWRKRKMIASGIEVSGEMSCVVALLILAAATSPFFTNFLTRIKRRRFLTDKGRRKLKPTPCSF